MAQTQLKEWSVLKPSFPGSNEQTCMLLLALPAQATFNGMRIQSNPQNDYLFDFHDIEPRAPGSLENRRWVKGTNSPASQQVGNIWWSARVAYEEAPEEEGGVAQLFFSMSVKWESAPPRSGVFHGIKGLEKGKFYLVWQLAMPTAGRVPLVVAAMPGQRSSVINDLQPHADKVLLARQQWMYANPDMASRFLDSLED